MRCIGLFLIFKVLYMKHFTLNDRFMLKNLLDKGYSKTKIADILGVHLNSIRNEILRICDNSRSYEDYDPKTADDMYRANLKEKGNKPKLMQDEKQKDYLREKILNQKYSPKACMMEIKNEGLDFDVEIKSVNTIYRYIKEGYMEGVSLESLPRGKSRRKKKRICRKQNRPVAGTSIEARDQSVDKREEFGHWEMDCVIGRKSNQRTALVLTERKTRFEIIEVLRRKSAYEVIKALNRLEKRYGKDFYEVFKTITLDNGPEFYMSEGMEKSLYRVGKRVKIYYCHPYSSYERGTNENNNILIRYWLPKSSNFDDSRIFNRTIVKNIQKWINLYPRELFDGGTADSKYREELQNLGIKYVT